MRIDLERLVDPRPRVALASESRQQTGHPGQDIGRRRGFEAQQTLECVDRSLRPAALFLGDAQVEPGVALLGTGFEQRAQITRRKPGLLPGHGQRRAFGQHRRGAAVCARGAFDQCCGSFETAGPTLDPGGKTEYRETARMMVEDRFAAGERCVRVGRGLARDRLQYQHGVGRRAHGLS